MPAEVVVANGCTLQVHCKEGAKMPLEPFCETDFFSRGICTGNIDEEVLSLVGAKSHSKLCLEQLPQIGWTSSHYAPVRFLFPFSVGARRTHFHPPSFTAFAAQSALSMGPSTRHGEEMLVLERGKQLRLAVNMYELG
jgi:hypothetical protein